MKSHVLLTVWCNYFWWGWRGNLTLITLRSERVNRKSCPGPYQSTASRLHVALCFLWRVGGPVTFPQNPVQLRGAMDKSAQIYADESEMGPRLGVLPNHRQVTPLEQPVCNAGAHGPAVHTSASFGHLRMRSLQTASVPRVTEVTQDYATVRKSLQIQSTSCWH